MTLSHRKTKIASYQWLEGAKLSFLFSKKVAKRGHNTIGRFFKFFLQYKNLNKTKLTADYKNLLKNLN